MAPCGSRGAPSTASARWSTSSGARPRSRPPNLWTRIRHRSRSRRWRSGTTCRRSSSSRSCRRSSTAASSGRRSAPTAAMRSPTDPASVSIGRVIRLLDGALAPLPCVSLRYYEPLLVPGRGDLLAPRRDARRPRRDARDPRPRDARGPRRSAGPRLDRSARTSMPSARGPPAVTPRPQTERPVRRAQSRSRLRSAALTRSSSVPPIVASASAIRDASRASASE